MTDGIDNARVLQNLRAIIRAEVRSLLGFPAAYGYVIARAASDTIDATPTDDTLGLPGLNQVPMEASSIGSVTPSVGKKCRIIFENGDRRRPRCVWVEPDAGTPVVRLGDSVQVTITPANIVTMALANGSGPVTATNPVTVSGQTTGASSKVTSE